MMEDITFTNNKVKYNKTNNNIELNNLTKESIVTAVLLLMENMPYNKITITDICKKAGVSRNAFYRNYPKKDAIMRYYLFKITEDYRKSLRVDRTHITAYEMFYCLLVHMKNHKKLIHSLLTADLSYLLIDTIFLAFRDCFRSIDFHYKEAHFSGSFYTVCIHWLYNDSTRSAKDVTKLILKYHNMDPHELIKLHPVTDMKTIAEEDTFQYHE